MKIMVKIDLSRLESMIIEGMNGTVPTRRIEGMNGTIPTRKIEGTDGTASSSGKNSEETVVPKDKDDDDDNAQSSKRTVSRATRRRRRKAMNRDIQKSTTNPMESSTEHSKEEISPHASIDRSKGAIPKNISVSTQHSKEAISLHAMTDSPKGDVNRSITNIERPQGAVSSMIQENPRLLKTTPKNRNKNRKNISLTAISEWAVPVMSLASSELAKPHTTQSSFECLEEAMPCTTSTCSPKSSKGTVLCTSQSSRGKNQELSRKSRRRRSSRLSSHITSSTADSLPEVQFYEQNNLTSNEEKPMPQLTCSCETMKTSHVGLDRFKPICKLCEIIINEISTFIDDDIEKYSDIFNFGNSSDTDDTDDPIGSIFCDIHRGGVLTDSYCMICRQDGSLEVIHTAFRSAEECVDGIVNGKQKSEEKNVPNPFGVDPSKVSTYFVRHGDRVPFIQSELDLMRYLNEK